jgi:DNA-binding PadR family transcriptional regulator
MEASQGPRVPSQKERSQDLPELDLMVLRQLHTGSAVLAFQGLRHSLHVHQERLSRSLQRLESEGLVRKTDKGYEITQTGTRLALQGARQEDVQRVQVLTSFLPLGTDPRVIASNLEGRWFGRLRWLGITEGIESTELRWVTDGSDVEVVLKITMGRLTIDTNAKDNRGMVEAFLAAQQIFSMVSGPWCRDWDGRSLPITT